MKNIETRAPEKNTKDAEKSNEDNITEILNLRLEKIALAVSFIATIFLIVFSSATAEAPLGIVAIGYLPLITTILLLHFEVEQSFKVFVYWATPFIIAIIFAVIFGLINPLLENQLSIVSLSSVNMLLGFIVVALLTLVEGKTLQDESIEPENVDEFIHSIEDKCKALNFVIGRVYKGSNGATDKMRSRLRINSELYNELNRIIEEDPVSQKHEAITILHKIKDRLSILASKEKDVFSSHELKNIKNLKRDPHGESSVIDVLVANDKDPVEHYFVGAANGVEKLLDYFLKL